MENTLTETNDLSVIITSNEIIGINLKTETEPHGVTITDPKADRYKHEQMKRMEKLVVGAKDPFGNTIKKIFATGDEYIVYEIETKILTDTVKVYIDTVKEVDTALKCRLDEMKPNFEILKGLLYKVEDIDAIKSRIGMILSLGLDGYIDKSNELLLKLIKEIKVRYKKLFNFRTKYLICFFAVTITCMVISCLFYMDYFSGGIIKFQNFAYVATGGSIGGLIMLTFNLRLISFEEDVSRWTYFFYGLQRIFISMLFGVIIYIAIKANLIFGFVNNLKYPFKPIYGYAVFSIVAGFSLKLIPSLLTDLAEGKVKENKPEPEK